MERIAPLLQTVLWVGLIGGILWRFHKHIDSLLIAIQKRVDSGSKIKAGPFEIGAILHPQNPEQQNKKIDEEIYEVKQIEESGETKISEKTLRSQLFQSEDLALRAIQTEFGLPISRQLQVGRDIGFDGVFIKDGKAYVVEVKFARRRYPVSKIRQILQEMFLNFSRLGWRNVKVVIAFVYDDDLIDLVQEQTRIINSLEEYAGSVDVRCYSYKNLLQQFGIDVE